VALTGRLGLVALAAAVVVGTAVPSGTGLLVATLVLVALVVVDLVLAGSVRGLRFARDGDAAVRLGEPARVRLSVANPGSRRVRGRLRDAWPPSAGAAVQRHQVDVPAGERRRVTTDLLPTRRQRSLGLMTLGYHTIQNHSTLNMRI
jgi:uncharacterized protein (DUF58 family)